MLQGMYNLTSQMMTQQRNLNVIGYNMTNVSTAGHRADRLISTSFKEEIMHRTGNVDKKHDVPIGRFYMANTVDETVTYYGEKGTYDNTGLPLDFALIDNGFFTVRNENELRYTRNGSFIIDEDGYLALPDYGRVLDMEGNEILLNTDDITADSNGNIFHKDTGEFFAKIGVVDFDDYHASLKKDNMGLFIAQDGVNPTGVENAQILWQHVELSNVNMADEMVKMIMSQRAIQSAAQMLKMYDVLNAKISNDIGRLS